MDEPAQETKQQRDETEAERADRNFNELLQELRVMQTGVQLLTGFLLTLPFQARFADLDGTQRLVYLILVVLSVASTGVLIAPVSVHRTTFRRGVKPSLVDTADRLTRLALVLLGLVVTGTTLLAFDVVVSRTAGLIAGGGIALLLIVLWIVVPRRSR
ncbi:DUF6328 family protein [Salana multivorans]